MLVNTLSNNEHTLLYAVFDIFFAPWPRTKIDDNENSLYSL